MKKVMKFGGSSLSDAAQFKKVKAIVEKDPACAVVVVSAPGKRFSGDHKITDLLYLCHAHLQYDVSCDAVFEMIAARFLEIRDTLSLSFDLPDALQTLRQAMDQGISLDELVSRGEYFTARLMAEYLGFAFLDAADWLRFRLDGAVDQGRSYAALQRLADGRRVVIPGFYGALPDGQIKTFPRGGSDITGALSAAALNADVYENWTDVSGILMADPRIVDDPEPILRATYAELRELSHFGAQVLHEGTVAPVRERNIPLNIRNTNDPGCPGTWIQEQFEEPASPAQRFITGVAGRRHFTILTVVKAGMSADPGALRKILEIFEQYGIVVEYIPCGIDNESLVVSTEKAAPCLGAILSDLQEAMQPDDIKVTKDIAIVAAVGRKMASRPGISGRIFAALGEHGINIRMISQGPEELNIIVGVDDQDFPETVRVLYNSFVK